MKDFPHAQIPGDSIVVSLPKSPTQKNAFPECEPEGCTRGCHKFYEKHTTTLSFAFYATQDANKEPRKVCVYAFSCGTDIHGERVELLPAETPAGLLNRVVPILIRNFVELAVEEKEEHEIRDH